MHSPFKSVLVACLIATATFADDESDSALLTKIAATQRANIESIESLALSCVTKIQSETERKTIPQLVFWKPKEKLFFSNEISASDSIGVDERKSLSPTELYGGIEGLANVWDAFQYASGRWTVQAKEGKADEYIVTTTVSINGVNDLFLKKRFIEWHIKKENAYMPHHVVYREGTSLLLSELICTSTVAYGQIDGTVIPKMLIHKHPRGLDVRTLMVQTSLNAPQHVNINHKLNLSTERLFGTPSNQPARGF